MGQLFGTDGIRGIPGTYPLDVPTIYRLGRALVELGRRRIVIGRDTRASGKWISGILEQAIRSRGGEVSQAGVMTTPGVAQLSLRLPFDAGVVVSASHNPFRDNGIKILSGDGIKLTDAEEERIERTLLEDQDPVPRFTQPDPDGDPGDASAINPEMVRVYLDALTSLFPNLDLTSQKLVLDCAQGAAFHVAPRVLRELGAEVVVLNAEPDGRNINSGCGAVHPEQMARAVVESSASFGVAFDGDADRSILADERGRVLDGDHLLFMLGRALKRDSGLPSGCVVTTIMANKGLEVALEAEDLTLVRTRVGDRYVLEEMLKGGHALGGEPSGHLIMRAYSLAGDGILTALKIASTLASEGCALSELGRGFRKFPQVLLNVEVTRKEDFSGLDDIAGEIERVKGALGNRGRVVVRYSGTEPLVRIMLEGEDKAAITEHAEAIASRFRNQLGRS